MTSLAARSGNAMDTSCLEAGCDGIIRYNGDSEFSDLEGRLQGCPGKSNHVNSSTSSTKLQVASTNGKGLLEDAQKHFAVGTNPAVRTRRRLISGHVCAKYEGLDELWSQVMSSLLVSRPLGARDVTPQHWAASLYPRFRCHT